MSRYKAAAFAFALSAIASGPAAAQSAGQIKAYDYALKCWAVAGYIATQGGKAADGQASGRKAYDAAYRMGEVLGYPTARIARDLDATGAAEGAALLQNREYFERSRSECTQLGLL